MLTFVTPLAPTTACESATPVSVVNEDAKAYSWAKFLEAHFYTKHTKSACEHKALPDRIRYFAYKVSAFGGHVHQALLFIDTAPLRLLQNLAFRVHVEGIRLFEVVVPGLQLFMRPDIQSQLKAEESLGLARRADAYFHSVAARLQALEQEIALGREGHTAAEKCQPQLEEIRDVALEGRRAVNDLLVSVVKESGPEDTLCLTRVRRRLQDVVVKVDGLFLSLERAALPKERDVRRLTTNHLSRLFAERDPLERGPEAANLAPAAELDEGLPDHITAPDAHTESSVAAFARMADEAALGLPPHLGLSFDTMPLSGSTTPSTTTRPPSKKSSLQNSQHTSGTVTPTTSAAEPVRVSSPHDRSFRSKSGHVLVPDQPADDSDGNSSPTTQLKAPVRPRPRKGKIAAMPQAAVPGMITDSSCTEAGEATDAPIVSSLVSQFDANAAMAAGTSKDAKPRRPAPERTRVTGQPQRVLSDGDSLPPSRAPSRPISPVQRQRRGGPTAPTFCRTQSGPTGREKTPATRGGSRAAPPSSYRPLNTRGRASESESDAPNMRNMPTTRNLPAGLPLASRPPLSRRASGKSDSGSESPVRPFRRKVSAPKPPTAARAPSRVPVPSTSARGRVSTIARHFDRINREAERERERQKRALALRARRALPIAVSSARIAEYTSVTAAVESDESSSEDEDEGHEGQEDSHSDGGEEADSEAEPDGPESLPKRDVRSSTPLGGDPEGLPGTSGTREAGDKEVGKPSTTAEPDSSTSLATEVEKLLPNMGRPPPATPTSGETAAMERGSLLKTISSFWASRTGVVLPLLEYPLSSEQHLFADSPLLLREDEPSSTIAFTLVSAQYKDRLQSLRSARNDTQASSADADASMASWNIVEHNQSQYNDIESSLRRPEGVHLRFDFESGTSRFHCRILFAEQFDALRRCCGCEDSTIGSLARCVKWDSSGGKSKMTFLKTRDDRLVLKQLSSSELTSFSTFAPHYFAHMAECLMHGKATTLVKIFGLYRISMRNQATGKSYKLDVLVMENLFYGRKCARIFDLKGSMRNRYLKETGAPGEVLLDENLVEISLQKPLFIREASKAMLRHALKHDSDFLADMNIMDYSVIIGVDTSDEDNPELVVGIIDFLRSYTWDKRVETFVKEQSSLLGAAKGELPTVITPKQYANRFLSFLDGILLLSPDSWYNDTSRGASPYTGGGKSGGGANGASHGEAATQGSEKK